MTTGQVQQLESLITWLKQNIEDFLDQGLDASSIASRFLSIGDQPKQLSHDTVTKVISKMYFS